MKPTHPKYNRLAGELRRARTARDGTLKANREMRKHIKALEERNAELEAALKADCAGSGIGSDTHDPMDPES